MVVGTHMQIDMVIKKQVTPLLLLDFIHTCIQELHLHLVQPPCVYNHEQHFTAVAIIAESHIIVCAYDSTVFIDVFSCVPFEKDKVLELCIKYFSPTEYYECLFERGFEGEKE